MSYTEECEASVSHQTEGMRMKTKVITLAVVVAMLSVCFAGIINYSDDVNADYTLTGKGTEAEPYLLPDVTLSELKNNAVVYFNLSYDKQFVTGNPPVVTVDKSSDVDGVLTVDPSTSTLTDYRYSAKITADTKKISSNSDIDVLFIVDLEYRYSDISLTESVYYKTTVTVLMPAGNPDSIEMKFQGNVAYSGKWTETDGKYIGEESEDADATVLFPGQKATFYSNNLPAGLYLKKLDNGATIVGMLGSKTADGTFDVYTVTDTDVTKTTVRYSVVETAEGAGFKYSVADVEDEEHPIIKDANADKTVLVKAGTELTLTTTVNLTEVKVTNSTNDTYELLTADSDGKYTISSPGISGTVKVFMTYNNGINDNRTIELTIIYIGSSADASLVNPVVRSY